MAFGTITILDGVSTTQVFRVYSDASSRQHWAHVRTDGADNMAPAMDAAARAGYQVPVHAGAAVSSDNPFPVTIIDSESPAAAALADNTANPTTTLVGSCLMVWDGATWDRGPGTAADGLLVNLGANNDVTATQSGTWNVGTITTLTSVTNPVAVTQSGSWSVTVSGTATVSGTVAATQSGTWNVGTVTSITNPVAVTDNADSLTVDAPVGTPVFVRLSDGSSPITTLPVSLASVPSHAVTNAGTFAVQVDGTSLTRLTDIETNTDSLAVVGNGAAATAQRVTLANDSTGVLGGVTSLTQMNGQAIAMGTGTRSAGTQRVTIATDDVVPASQSGTWTVQPGNTANTTPWLVKEQKAATPTQSSVGDSASSVTLLASNANRLGATIYNDSSAVLYVKLGATASATSFTVLLAGNGSGIGGYYEVPFGFTGAIDGIWASDAGGNARITELA